ncbi:MAG: DNA alkylation repair protein [Phycisphaerales bacterium]
MAKRSSPAPKKPRKASPKSTPADSVNASTRSIVDALKRLGTQRVRDDMANRYGITGPSASTAFGVGMAAIQKVAKGAKSKDATRNHALAAALWDWKGPGQYEARMVAIYVDEPALVTGPQMDRWTKDFDNWGICDTACFKLFDQVAPKLAFERAERWCAKREEFIRRAGLALLACLALHNKELKDKLFLRPLELVELAATDERNFVKKGANWALRAIGRRSRDLNAAATTIARRLADSTNPAPRWVGKDALKALE